MSTDPLAFQRLLIKRAAEAWLNPEVAAGLQANDKAKATLPGKLKPAPPLPKPAVPPISSAPKPIAKTSAAVPGIMKEEGPAGQIRPPVAAPSKPVTPTRLAPVKKASEILGRVLRRA